jgi:hypothetical protein
LQAGLQGKVILMFPEFSLLRKTPFSPLFSTVANHYVFVKKKLGMVDGNARES